MDKTAGLLAEIVALLNDLLRNQKEGQARLSEIQDRQAAIGAELERQRIELTMEHVDRVAHGNEKAEAINDINKRLDSLLEDLDESRQHSSKS